MLSEQEAEEIKDKLITHIESTFPTEQIDSAKEQIESMNTEQLEEFLNKNKIFKENEESSSNECVFCSIASGKIKSCKLDENKDAIAVLDINPISKGHVLIIAKIHSEKSQRGIKSLADKVSKKIKNKFSPKRVDSSNSRLFGHEVINLLPIYDKETFDSKREHSTLEQLEEIKSELERKKEKIQKQRIKPKIEQIKEFLWLPKRIP